jgi:three-Cys-motif partner protein
MPRKKSNDDFFEEGIKFFCENGNKLATIYPEFIDEYNDHSLLKLIAITYWAAIFSPIAHNTLGKLGYKVAYVDTMAGSGVTKTRRAGDRFCGSCTGAVLKAIEKGYPFNKVIAVEIDADKARSLDARLKDIDPKLPVSIHNNAISETSRAIAEELSCNCISYIVIDPEGFKGLSWKSIGPLLECKGDAIITWFENDIWRMKSVALSCGQNAEGNATRLTELIGSDEWMSSKEPSDITNAFIGRVLKDTNKASAEFIDIKDVQRKHYKMILFTGRFRNSKVLAKKWKEIWKDDWDRMGAEIFRSCLMFIGEEIPI